MKPGNAGKRQRRRRGRYDARAELARIEATERQALATLMAVIFSNPVFKAAWDAHVEAADAAGAAQRAFDATRRKRPG